MKIQQRVASVGVSALAREVGLSPGAVSRKLAAGITAEQIREEAARKQPFAGTKAAKKPPKKPPKSEYDLIIKSRERADALGSVRFRHAQAMAERGEIDNMLKRGELVPIAYVRKWATRYLIEGRDMLLAGPSELADQLAAESDPLQAAEIVRRWLERVLGTWQQLDKLWGGGAGEEEQQVA